MPRRSPPPATRFTWTPYRLRQLQRLERELNDRVEIAEFFGISPAAVRGKLHHLRRFGADIPLRCAGRAHRVIKRKDYIHE